MSQVVSFIDYKPAARFDGVPWTAAKVEEGDSSAGPWTLIDTIALSPVDSNPADPRTRNLTTSNASDTPDLWYRLTFVDGSGGEGNPSAAIQNAVPQSPFASVDDLAARLGETLSEDEGARASTLLSLSSGLIRQKLRQQISLIDNDTLTVRSVYGDRYRLPERPVNSVDSVYLTAPGGSPQLVDPASYYLDGDELVRVTYRILFPELTFGVHGRGWFGPNWTLTVTYSHGYAEIPELVRGICLEMVVRAWTNPASIAQESIGDVSTLYYYAPSRPTGLLMADTELKELVELFRRHSGSTQLR